MVRWEECNYIHQMLHVWALAAGRNGNRTGLDLYISFFIPYIIMYPCSSRQSLFWSTIPGPKRGLDILGIFRITFRLFFSLVANT